MPTSRPIEDYALIGDCETAALVSHDGSIDWLCWPSFSSGACFAAILGDTSHGHWRIAPTGNASARRRYEPHTLVLETVFDVGDEREPEKLKDAAGGSVLVIDYMPVRDRHSHVVRIVRGIRGVVAMRMDLALRFDYGSITPWVTKTEDGIRAIAGPDMVLLRSSAPLRGEAMTTVSEFNISAGEEVTFVLSYGASYEDPPAAIDPFAALAATRQYWRNWASLSVYKGAYADAVERSLITLKALTYRPTGGVIAAPTTSLPEQAGGPRNWDYRYCWLRDTSFTLLALIDAGYQKEAMAWQQWLLRAVAGSPDQIQTLYGICGERQLVEWEVPWLPGYAGSKPVRIGNAASQQFQLDVFGEIAAALLHTHDDSDKLGTGLALQCAMTTHLETVWSEPDEGIWEVRSGRQHFTYSKVMAWLAFDCAIQRLERKKPPLDKEESENILRWSNIRQQIHDDVCSRGFNTQMNSFVQSYGSMELDASCLLIAMVGFLPPTDPRIRGTVEAIEANLMPDGLVLRYNTQTSDDGLPPGEGVFLACSFWMVSNLVLLGRNADAQRLFDKLLALANDVGLLAEEYNPSSQRFAGNFPQALSHLALTSAAFTLAGMKSKLTNGAAIAPGATSLNPGLDNQSSPKVLKTV